ncbi:hypothetical protein KAR29_02785 [Aminithiophilus ramosus]|uniref:Uncharacterized protein n=1 Tax=Aminithiophilus ramosus TaxID=3029084 RepID=A0A9Q7A953_9BACT|nr:hypothetical protein [Aminithiophilus ramosus]QTX32865.1 hypothetical protein KAR29_02785 [Aminithiophilus ramosus]
MKRPLVYLIEATVQVEGGFRRLVGDWPEPTSEELEEVLEAWPRVLRRPSIPFAKVLVAIGGWPSIVSGVGRWGRANPQDWSRFVEIGFIRKFPAVSHKKSRWRPLISKYGKTRQTLVTYFRLAIEGMADEILAGAGISTNSCKKAVGMTS